MRKLLGVLLSSFVCISLLWAAPAQNSGRQKLRNLPVMGGSNEPVFDVRIAPQRLPHQRLDDYIGITDTAGTTYYDYQHNGTCGRMIDVDDLGVVSMVWMNGLTDGMTRAVYHNIWDPVGGNFIYDTIGVMISTSPRAGYVCQTALVIEQFCFAFHQRPSNCSPSHAVAVIPPVISEPDWCYVEENELEIIWPKIDADEENTLHLISTENPQNEPWIPYPIYYSRGIPEYDPDGFVIGINWDPMSCGGFEIWDTLMTISPDIACSRHSLRCAAAWCHSMDDLSANPSQYNNEIYMKVSEDGGLNWGDFTNVTQWTPWDPDCYHSGGDPLECDRDTLRAYTDVSILFDEEDNIHLAFTTIGFWWYLPGESDSGFSDDTKSMIYHWSEEMGYYSLIADGWYEAYQPGYWQRNVQRPSLALDPQTGYLYCSYMRFDETTYSEGGFPMADAFVTVSTDNGMHWAVGTNVTNTTPDTIPVPFGESEHERDVTVAPLVTDSILHMEYIFDKDAGSLPQMEGGSTLNPVIYQRIPISEIPTSPLMPNYPMHWDSAGHPPDASAPVVSSGLPEQFVLHQNYPNPFNPTTTIQFDMLKRAEVNLRVYNILGQEVETLLSETSLSAGAHKIAFDGAHLPSGIYFYRFETPYYATSRKMIFLK